MMLMTPFTAFSPDGSTRPANHLDAFDIFEQRILHFPICAVEESSVDSAAIHQHQDGAVQARTEAVNSDRPMIAVDACDFHAGREAQSLRYVCGAGPPDIFAGYDKNGGSGVEGFFRFFGGSGYFDL